MRLRVLIGILAVLLFNPLSTSFAEECGRGTVETWTQGAEAPSTEIIPLCQNTIHYQALMDGVVVGEATFQVEEMEVIIQIEGEPLSRLKGRKQSMIAASADLEHMRSKVKGEILRLDNEIRGKKRLPLRNPGEGIKREFRQVLNGLAMRIRREALPDIERIPGVLKVWRDQKARAYLSESVPLIGADRVAAQLGISGKGVVVAVIDTGIDYTHPDLGGCLGARCKVIRGYDFVNHDPNPMDDNGHGTHVAGIVAANGTIKGVAPGAKLMAAKVLDQYGTGSFSNVIAGIEWAVDPDGNPGTDDGAQVINLSLGGPGDPDDPVSQAVDNAVAAGVVVVVAAGNSGSGYETIGSPGVARNALTVGASNKKDQIASFSSRGPAPVTYQIKPEVTAPGVAIRSSVPRGNCELCNASGYGVLNGTSMATPHVAGVAALLLEQFPYWDPSRVLEAILQRSRSLGLGVFIQGSGRVDAYSAAVSPAIATPGNWSLGLDTLAQPTFHQTKTGMLTNLTSKYQSYSLAVQGVFPAGLTALVMPGSLSLAPGEAKTFTFELTVDNSAVPNPPLAPYAYEGAIVAEGGEETLRLPFAFTKSPSLNVSFDEAPLILSVHNRTNLVKWMPEPGTSRTFLLPQGTYDVIAIYGNVTTRVLREGVPVTSQANLAIRKAEAVHPFTILPIDKNGNPLHLSPRSMMVSLFQHKVARFTEISYHWGAPTEFQFSPMSNGYLFEASILETLNPLLGPSYTFHGYARDGINGPLKFQPGPTDFKRVLFRHMADPGTNQVLPHISFGAVTSNMSVSYSTDVPLTTPFEEETYHLPAPYPEFFLGLTRKDVFRQPPSTSGSSWSDFLYSTPYLRAKDRSTLEGYFLDLDAGKAVGYRILVSSTPAEKLPLGIGPYSWYGQFENLPGEIRISAAVGNRSWLYLGQLLDLRPHDPLSYELFQDGRLLRSGSWTGVGNPFLSAPSASLPVASGAYTLKIPFSNYFIAGRKSSAMMEATFDTRKTDPNPPSVIQFNILENGSVTDTLVSGNGQVVFKVKDQSSLSQISLFYNAGNGWLPFTLTKTDPDTYLAYVPTFPAETFVSLKAVARDSFGNQISYEINPAFLAKVASGGNKPVFAVNCGGPSYVDKTGVVYQSDTQFSGGSTYKTTAPIAGTDDDILYQSERFGNFSYNVPLTNGNYLVTLKFAEIYNSYAGGRIFDVKIEGPEVISNLDIFAKGGKNKAYDVTFPVAITDGILNLEFRPDVGNAKVSAIFVAPPQIATQYVITATAGIGGTIHPQGAVAVAPGSNQAFTVTANSGNRIAEVKVDGIAQGPIPSYTFTNVLANHTIEASFAPDQPNTVVFAVNCGGPPYTDRTGIVYQADTQFSGGSTFQTTAPIAGTEDDILYQSERFGSFSYNIPLANGNYLLTLRFAEIHYTSYAGSRIFDVKIEGKEVTANLDLFVRAGKNKAYDLAFPVTVADGILNVEFRSDVGNAKVSAILVLRP